MKTEFGKLNLGIWIAITKKFERIYVPNNYPKAGIRYWTFCAVQFFGYEPKFLKSKPMEGAYIPTATKGMAVMFSEGLESSLMVKMFPYAKQLVFTPSDKVPWTDPIEPLLAIYAADLGYNITYFGQELRPFSKLKPLEGKDEYETLVTLWYAYTNCYFTSPLIGFTKLQVLEAAIRSDVKFNSCYTYYKDKQWCGRCIKCLQIHTLYEHLGKPSGFILKDSAENIISGATESEANYTNELIKSLQ